MLYLKQSQLERLSADKAAQQILIERELQQVCMGGGVGGRVWWEGGWGGGGGGGGGWGREGGREGAAGRCGVVRALRGGVGRGVRRMSPEEMEIRDFS